MLTAGTEPALAQLGVGPLDGAIDGALDRRIPRLEERLERGAGEEVDAARQRADEGLPAAAPEGAQRALQGTTGEAAAAAVEAASPALAAAGAVPTATMALLRPFVRDVDPSGREIEKDVLVLLVDARQRSRLVASGLTIIAERRLDGLGLTMVTLRGSGGAGAAQRLPDLRQAMPGAAIDFNHLYQWTAGEEAAAPPAVQPDNNGNAAVAGRIGLIDSAVEEGHFSLQPIRVVHNDLVMHDAPRPLTHGTAVASLIAKATGNAAEVYSASVFFQVPGYAPGASTESLVAALDWLAAQQVDAINMSLAGPANALLERALAALAANGGPAVVAAVGNNGPSGEPLYPGAYESVIGVTAVDRRDRIYRYANRGDHVDFAALGVDVKVADSGGGWRVASGTSMAAPLVAAAVAQLYRERGTATGLLSLLIADARDLGRRGFDPVFGHGIVLPPPQVVSRVKTSPLD